MRITQVLCGFNEYRHFGLLWKQRQSIQKVIDHGIPKFIIDKKIPVYDAVKFASERDPVDFKTFFPPQSNKPHAQWAYMINHKTRLLEGPLQAQILTNTMAHSKLPKEYEEAFDSMSVGEDEIKWYRNRLELNSLDSQQFKLPHRIDPERVWHRFPRDFGPGIRRETLEFLSVMNDFMRLQASSGTNHSGYKPLLHELACQYVRPAKRDSDGTSGDNPYVFQGFASSATVTLKSLAVLSSSDSAKASGPTGQLPSMYPTLPEVDLTKRHQYSSATICPTTCVNMKPGEEGSTPARDSNSSLALHTLFISHPWNDDSWKLSEKLGRAILQTFTFAAAQTVSQLGESTGDLPFENRLRLQTIYHDLEHIGFIVFHLNTLVAASNGDPEGPIRNELYHECVPVRENEQINSRALKWLKVFYEA